MITTMVSDSNLHTTTAHSWMLSTQMRHTAIGAIGETSTPEKGGWPGLDKSDGQPQNLVKGSLELYHGDTLLVISGNNKLELCHCPAKQDSCDAILWYLWCDTYTGETACLYWIGLWKASYWSQLLRCNTHVQFGSEVAANPGTLIWE